MPNSESNGLSGLKSKKTIVQIQVQTRPRLGLFKFKGPSPVLLLGDCDVLRKSAPLSFRGVSLLFPHHVI